MAPLSITVMQEYQKETDFLSGQEIPLRKISAGGVIFSFSSVFYNRFSGITESFFSFVNTSLHT